MLIQMNTTDTESVQSLESAYQEKNNILNDWHMVAGLYKKAHQLKMQRLKRMNMILKLVFSQYSPSASSPVP